jgi:hypothetical protein
MRVKNQESSPWPIIIGLCVVFWPLGLFLLAAKLASDRSLVMKCGKTVRGVSFLVMGMGTLYLVAAFVSNNSVLAVPAVICGSGGVLLTVYASRIEHTAERYKKYLHLIANQNQTSIDTLASAAGVSYSEAVKDLTRMIDTCYFTGAHIDVTQRKIVLLNRTPAPAYDPFTAQGRVISCRNCGANNRIETRNAECEYCGSPLQ